MRGGGVGRGNSTGRPVTRPLPHPPSPSWADTVGENHFMRPVFRKMIISQDPRLVRFVMGRIASSLALGAGGQRETGMG